MTNVIGDPAVLLEKWYLAPRRILGQLPSGDGAIACLMMVLPLYERYIRHVERTTNKQQPDIISEDFHIGDKEKAKMFWNMLRDGFCHTGQPFANSDKARNPANNWTLPSVSFDAAYRWPPVWAKSTTGEDVICLNPWDFADFVLSKYKADPALLASHPDAPLLNIHLVAPSAVIR